MADEKKPDTIEATFRNGSLTAVSVIVGFSLSFLSRWAGLPGQWHRLDLIAVTAIVVGIGAQVTAMGDMLRLESLVRTRYERSIRIFMTGLGLVAFEVGLAIFGDVTGFGQHILARRLNAAA